MPAPLQALDGRIGLVEAEDQHGLVPAAERERVHVFDVDAGILEHTSRTSARPPGRSGTSIATTSVTLTT